MDTHYNNALLYAIKMLSNNQKIVTQNINSLVIDLSPVPLNREENLSSFALGEKLKKKMINVSARF